MDNIIHGANPESLYHAFNIPVPDKILDFSTNTNILAWPSININIEELASRYPDPDCAKLTSLISERERVSESRILFTNGTNQAIYLLSHVLTGRTGILQPCYPEYSRAFPDSAGTFSLEDSGRFDNFIIVNPSNPTGRFIPDLSRTIARFPATRYIIDEAYIDFLIHDEAPERLCELPNVIILRSLTKIFHLSGARIGYVIASEDMIARLKAIMPTWSVNGIAQELALRFLKDDEFYARTRSFYREHTPRFIEGLIRAGFEVMNSSVHFFLVRADDDVIVPLLRQGVVVRHTRNFSGLDGRYIRVATRRPDENRILVESLHALRLVEPPPE